VLIKTVSAGGIFPTYDPGGGAFYQDETKLYDFYNSAIVQLDENGVRKWATVLSHESANTNDQDYDVWGISSKNNKLYFTGIAGQSNTNKIPLRNLSGAYYETDEIGSVCPFVGMFSNTGVLEWCTYFHSGNTGNTTYNGQPYDVQIDSEDNLWVFGQTSTSAGASLGHLILDPGGAFMQSSPLGSSDIIFTKFDSSLQPVWSSYYGGGSTDNFQSVTSDWQGRVCFAGYTYSSDFTTYDPGSGAYYKASTANNSNIINPYIVRFSDDNQINWATTYSDSTYFDGVEVGSNDLLYVTGRTWALTFDIYNETGSYNDASYNGGSSDYVFLKFDNLGTRQWATYYGGTDYEGGGLSGRSGINVYFDPCATESKIVVFGGTKSVDFPTLNSGGGAVFQGSITNTTAPVIIQFNETTISGESVAPTSASANPASVCSGIPTDITLTASGGTLGTGAVVQWYTGSCGGTFVGTGNPLVVSQTLSSNTTYYVRYSGICNTTTCASTTVNIASLSTTPSLISGTTTICSGGSTTLTASGGTMGTGASYQWYAGGCASGSVIGTNASITVSPGSNTTYYVRRTGTCNTTSCINKLITVVADPTITSQPSGGSICSGNSHELSVSASGGTPSLTYQWYNSSGAISGATSSTYSATISSNYYCIVSASGRGCSNATSNTVGVTVNPNLPVSVSIEASDNPICFGLPCTFTATPTNGGGSPSYQWKLDGSNVGSNSNTYNNSSLTDGNTITCVLTSSEGCTTGNPATSSSIVMDVTTPSTTTLSAGDYVWSGNSNVYWGTASNWLSYNGSAFNVASVLPTTENDVQFIPYNGCAANTAHIGSGTSVNCKDITIKTSLIMDNTSVLNVYGNWDNQGTFTANNNTVVFKGSSSQNIGGSAGTSFSNLTIDNSSGLTNGVKLNVSPASPTIVTGTLTLTNGKLTSSASNLLVLNTGSESSSGAVNSFVEGPMKKIGSTAFVFPIGNETTWARIGIASLSGVEEFTAQYFHTGYGDLTVSQSSPYDLDHVSEGEYWTLSRAGTKTASVRLYTEDTEQSVINDCSDLVIAHWNGTSWENIISNYSVTSAGCNTPTGQPLNIVSSESYTSFSPFTFGSKKKASNPLPIELVYFKAECDNTDAILYWQTASETNNDYFVVEKSNDMQNFFEIGIIPGSGNSNQLNNYSFTDNSLFSGNNYYRLKQIDYNGEYTVYGTIAVNCDKDQTGMLNLLAYPNPFNNELNIVVEEVKDKNFVIELFDQLGNIVFVEDYYSSENTFYITIDLTDIAPAVYNLRCRSKDNVIYLKLVKKY